MQTSFTLDYVSATTKIHSLKQLIERFSFGLSFDEWVSSKGHNGYEHSMKHPFGHYIQWTNKRDDMGVNVHFSGLPLKELHDTGENTLLIVYWLHEEGFKFTRLDFAIDVRGVKFDLEELQRCKFKGSVNKLPQLIKNGPNAEEGSTLYVGSRKSDKFIRIYDKRAQMEIDGEEWFRFELETGGKTATKMASMIYNMTDLQVGKFTQGVMRAMYNPDHADYQSAIDADPIKVSSTKDASHSTYDWLMSSIAPVLARVILELPHRDVMTTFDKEVQKHIREIAAKSLQKAQGINAQN